MNIVDTLKSHVTLPEGKDKTVYIILAILLGAYGVHNFWAGNQEKAKAQLIAGIIGTLLCGVGVWLSWITAILDVVNLDKKA